MPKEQINSSQRNNRNQSKRTVLRPTSPSLDASDLIRSSSLRVNFPSQHPTIDRSDSAPHILDRDTIPSLPYSLPLTPAERLARKIEHDTSIPNTAIHHRVEYNVRVDFHANDFTTMEKTFPEFKFNDWNKTNREQQKASTQRQQQPQSSHRKRRKSQMKASLSNTRLAQAMWLRKNSKKNTTPTKSNAADTNTNSNNNNPHLSPLNMQTRVNQSKNPHLLLHLLPEDDSIVLSTVHPSLLKTSGSETKKIQIIQQYNRSARKTQNIGPPLIVKKEIRKIKRGLKRFKKRNRRYTQKFSTMVREQNALAEEFNNSQKGSRFPDSSGGSSASASACGGLPESMEFREPLNEELSELAYDQIVEQFAAMDQSSGSTDAVDSGGGTMKESYRLSQRRLRSRTISRDSTGSQSRPVSSQSIRQATTRLTRAKEQLRSTIAHNDRRIMTAGGVGVGRLLGRPMSKSQKLRLCGGGSSSAGDAGGSSGLVSIQKAKIGVDGLGASSYRRTVINSTGGVSLNERYDPPPIHTSWLGLEPRSFSVAEL